MRLADTGGAQPQILHGVPQQFAPCGIGFHRIPLYKSNGRQIHPDWILGTDLARSHGCLRLSRELADRVWSFTTRRTPVRVV